MRVVIQDAQTHVQTAHVSSVTFGSLIQLLEVPGYWPHFSRKHWKPSDVFVLTRGYDKTDDTGEGGANFHFSGRLLVVNPDRGETYGLNRDTLVRVLQNAEVHVNENY